MQSQGGLRSVDEWISFAHQMKDAGTLFLLLTGEEPLLFPQFKRYWYDPYAQYQWDVDQ